MHQAILILSWLWRVKRRNYYLDDAEIVGVVPKNLELLDFRRFQILSLADFPDLDELAAGAAGDQVPDIEEVQVH